MDARARRQGPAEPRRKSHRARRAGAAVCTAFTKICGRSCSGSWTGLRTPRSPARSAARALRRAQDAIDPQASKSAEGMEGVNPEPEGALSEFWLAAGRDRGCASGSWIKIPAATATLSEPAPSAASGFQFPPAPLEPFPLDATVLFAKHQPEAFRPSHPIEWHCRRIRYGGEEFHVNARTRSSANSPRVFPRR